MVDALQIGALGLALGGGIAGLLQDEPDPIQVSPREIDPVEQEMQKFQFDMAMGLLEDIQDPSIKENILRLLNPEQMAQDTKQRFVKAFTEIKKEVNAVGASQAAQAGGAEIADLVKRGVISEEAGKRQIAANTQAVSAITNIANKKLDAAVGPLARAETLRRTGQNLGSASIIGQIDLNNRKLFNQAATSALDTFLKRGQEVSSLKNTLARVNIGSQLEFDEQKRATALNFGFGAAGSVLDTLEEHKEREQFRALAKEFPDSEAFQKLLRISNPGAFS